MKHFLDFNHGEVLVALQRNFEFCFNKMKHSTKKQNKGEAQWKLALKAATELTANMMVETDQILMSDPPENEEVQNLSQEEIEKRLSQIGATVNGKDILGKAEGDWLHEWEMPDQKAKMELLGMGYTEEQIEAMREELVREEHEQTTSANGLK